MTIAAQSANQLDVVVTGKDGRLWTAAWNQNVAQGKWQGWWTVTATAKEQGTAYPALVSRTSTSLDVVYIDTAGEVSAAAWDQSIANAIWRG